MTLAVAAFFLLACGQHAFAAKVTLDLAGWKGVKLVGAVQRFDQDGNARRPVDPNAKIDAPHVDFRAADAGGGQWVFANLPVGKYDLVIVADGRVRVEGWYYAPVQEFDPAYPPDSKIDPKTRDYVVDHIKKSRHYENKVEPLAVGGDAKVARILVMLIRDLPTSYKEGYGTMRHEIWQYSFKYGGWAKEQRTHVLDRLILPVDELRKWTWLWDAKLGGIDASGSPIAIKCDPPKAKGEETRPGLFPY
jgi:hypothetical protein